MIRSVEFIVEALAESEYCPDMVECIVNEENGCTKCWLKIVKGGIEKRETKILQPNKDTAEKG